jgi:glutamate-ammonia-ligase adenylyltransferase
MLVVSLESFERYQADDAWVWEHLALTRARVVFGSDDAVVQTQGVLTRTLYRPRDMADFAREAVKMRRDIAKHKPPAGPLDVKLARGGLVDLEFLTHITQFRTSCGFLPNMADALTELSQAGALSSDLLRANELLTRYLIVSRLVSPDLVEPPVSAQALVAKRCGMADWDSLRSALDSARASVSAAWDENLGHIQETDNA